MNNNKHPGYQRGTMGGMVIMGVIAISAHLLGCDIFFAGIGALTVVMWIGYAYETNMPQEKPKRKRGE